MNPFLFALAVLPCIAICVYVYFLDKYDREPKAVLITSFLLGVFACMPAYFIEQIGGAMDYAIRIDWLRTLVFAFVVVALTEEGVKYLFLRYYCYRLAAFNEPLDGIVYSLMVSMGFAAFENVVYSMNNDPTTLAIRMLTAIPAHASFAIIMGYHIGLAKTETNSRDRRLMGLLAAIIAHGSYDFFLFQTYSELLRLAAFGILGICILYAWRLLRFLLVDSQRRWTKV
jgi:protease PrsW